MISCVPGLSAYRHSLSLSVHCAMIEIRGGRDGHGIAREGAVGNVPPAPGTESVIRVRYDKVRRLKRARSGSVRWDVWVALSFEYTYRVQYGMLTQSGKNTPIPRAPTTAYLELIAGYSKKTYTSSSSSIIRV